jgi:hypothetical protein
VCVCVRVSVSVRALVRVRVLHPNKKLTLAVNKCDNVSKAGLVACVCTCVPVCIPVSSVCVCECVCVFVRVCCRLCMVLYLHSHFDRRTRLQAGPPGCPFRLLPFVLGYVISH